MWRREVTFFDEARIPWLQPWEVQEQYKEVLKKATYQEYTYISDSKQTTNLLAIKNNSDISCSLEVTAIYMDKNGKEIGRNKDVIYSWPTRHTSLLTFNLAGEYESIRYEMNAKALPKHNKVTADKLEVSKDFSTNDSEITSCIKNIGTEAAYMTTVHTLFLKKGIPVGYETNQIGNKANLFNPQTEFVFNVKPPTSYDEIFCFTESR